jgi:hypothetical protein
VAPDFVGVFEVPPEGGGGVFAIDFTIVLPAPGRYLFVLRMDREELAICEVRAVELSRPSPPEVSPEHTEMT